MKLVSRVLASIALFITFFASAIAAMAEGELKTGQPTEKAMWLQGSGSQMADKINWFAEMTTWLAIGISVFVMALLFWVMVRYNKRANPVPSRTSHHSLIEVIWTVVPIIILIFVAIPSFQLLDDQVAPKEEPAFTVKVTGYQWYWGYEYQDDSGVSFDSLMLKEDERAASGKTDKDQYPRLLAVDNEMVVPVGKMVRVLVTAADVIHAWTVPSFGPKMDGYPGRLNETWFKADKEGIYYGQCSELCGKDHAFMPIAVRVVSQAQFDAWKAAAKDDLEGANKALMAAIELETNVKLAASR